MKLRLKAASIPTLTFTAIFGGGYAYGQLQHSRHQRMAQGCLDHSQDALSEIVRAGKRVSELPAPLESMARDEGAWLFYLPRDQWVPCGLMYCEGSYSGWRRTRPLADDWYFFWDAS